MIAGNEMAKFTTFGIWDDSVRHLIGNIVIEDCLQLTPEELTEFFYETGTEVFCRGEFLAISEDLIPYLESKRQYPPCFKAQVAGNKLNGLLAMRAKLLKTFPQTSTTLQELYDSFIVEALIINDDFFKVEADVRSGLNDYDKKRRNYVSETAKFDEYYLQEYDKRLLETTDPVLKEKIQAHIRFIKEAAVLPIYTPITKPIPVQQQRSLSDETHMIMLPTAADSESQRSKSLNDKPSPVSHGGIFDRLRRKSSIKETVSDTKLDSHSPVDPTRVHTH
jgi:hypothetical protein